MRIYEATRQNGKTEEQALSDAKLKYPTIVLKKLRKWKPTKNLQSARVGKHPRDMNKKPGRKKKLSNT